MEIQRQSDYYGLDRPEPRQAHLTADQIASLIAGPQITPGLLNTRTAWRQAAPMTDPGGGASADTMAIAAGPEGATPNIGIAMPTVGSGINALTSEISLDPSSRGSYDGADFNPGPMYFPPD